MRQLLIIVGSIAFSVGFGSTFTLLGSDRGQLVLESIDKDGKVTSKPYGTYSPTQDRIVGIGSFDGDTAIDVALERTRRDGLRSLLVYCHHPRTPTNYVLLLRHTGPFSGLRFGFGVGRFPDDAGLSLFGRRDGSRRMTSISWSAAGIRTGLAQIDKIRSFRDPAFGSQTVLGGVADFDQDGLPDFAVRDPGSGAIKFTYQRPDGWEHSAAIRDSAGVFYMNAATVLWGGSDVDGDGQLDLIAQPTDPVPSGNPRPMRVWYLGTRTRPAGTGPFLLRNEPVTYEGRRYRWSVLAVGGG